MALVLVMMAAFLMAAADLLPWINRVSGVAVGADRINAAWIVGLSDNHNVGVDGGVALAWVVILIAGVTAAAGVAGNRFGLILGSIAAIALSTLFVIRELAYSGVGAVNSFGEFGMGPALMMLGGVVGFVAAITMAATRRTIDLRDKNYARMSLI